MLESTVRVVSSFQAGTDGEAVKSQELILALLRDSPEPFSRHTFTPGHITCTGAVLNPARDKLLLVHHKRLNRWLLPGGHVEREDAGPEASARREVLEETGAQLAAGAGILLNLDVHAIPPKKSEPLHLHHDLIWGLQAVAEELVCSEESRAVLWCGLDEFDRYDLPAPIRRAAERLIGS